MMYILETEFWNKTLHSPHHHCCEGLIWQSLHRMWSWATVILIIRCCYFRQGFKIHQEAKNVPETISAAHFVTVDVTSPQTVIVFSGTQTHSLLSEHSWCLTNGPQTGHLVCIIHHDTKRWKWTALVAQNTVQAWQGRLQKCKNDLLLTDYVGY